jgi:redox-regulated HSP33 family molecular chaperone
MSERMGYSSRCPKCGELRYIDGVSQDELRHLLDSKHHIRAHCSTCDEDWVVNERERAEIARGLALV